MKFAPGLIIVCLSFNVYAANWQKVERYNGKTFYIDIDSIKKQKDFVYYTELIDFKEAIYGALSRISKFKANCEKKEKANLSITSYTGQMGKYIIINEAKNNGTRFVKDPNSNIMKFACGYTN